MEMSESLPMDIMIDILLRLPAKPLIRFKSICKLWYNLISHPGFAKEHLHRSLATQSNLHFFYLNHVFYISDFDTFDNAAELNYPFKNPKHGGASVIGSCHGLFCLWNYDYRNFIVFLFNPTTRTHRFLPYLPRPSHVAHLTHEFIYGFGYDSVTDDYKFVRILQCSSKETDETYSELMIYSMKMYSWFRVLDQVPIHFTCRHGDGVLLDENLHWVNDTERGEPVLPIVSFNLSTHSFGEVPVPPEMDMFYYCYMHVGVLDGCLCALTNNVLHSEIFIMKKYGVVESWAKLFRVDRDAIFDMERTIAFTNNRKALLIRFVDIWLASIDLETLAVENLSYPGKPSRRFDAHVCLENLLMLDCLSDLPESEEGDEDDLFDSEEEGEVDGERGEEEGGTREDDG